MQGLRKTCYKCEGSGHFMWPVKQEAAKSNAVTVKQGKSKSIASFSSVKAGPCHDQAGAH